MKLGEYLTVINGKNQKKVEMVNGQYPIYGSGGQIGRANTFICPKNTVIIGRKGTINTPIYVEEPFWNVDTAFGLSAKDNLDSRFLFWYCRHFNFLNISTSTTIPSLTKTSIENIEVQFPTKDKQLKIARKLDQIENAITFLTKREAMLIDLVKSRFNLEVIMQ